MAPIVSLLTLALAVASAGPAELVSANSGLEERSNSGPGHIYCTFDVQSGKFAPDGVERDIIAADVKCKRHTAYKRDLQPNWAGLQNVPSVRGPFGPIIAGKMGDKITYKVRNALTSTEAQKRMAALERPAGQMRKSTVPDSALEGLSSSERRQAVYGRAAAVHSVGGVVGKALHAVAGPSTSIHLHGLSFYNSEIFDGPAFVAQCPIPAGQTYTYETTLSTRPDKDEAGHTWWHSHMLTQYTDGMQGPMLISDPNAPYKKGKDYDEEILVTLTDWWHIPAEEAYVLSGNSSTWGPKGDPTNPDSILINGYGRYDCAQGVPAGMTCKPNAPWATFSFKRGKRYLLRIISTSTSSAYWFSIDNHQMAVVQADSTWTKRNVVNRIWVDIAQRYSVIVQANKAPTSQHWMRVQVDKAYYFSPAPILPNFTFGIVRYGMAPKNKEPTSLPPAKYVDLDVNTLRPYYAEPAPVAVAKQTYTFGFGTVSWVVNQQQYIPSSPSLLQKAIQSTSYVATDATYLLNAPDGKAVEVIIQSQDSWPHPWHIHGHVFYVLGTGTGVFNETMRGKLDTKNPMRRDTVTIPAMGYAVLRIVVDNPGVWFSHCHISWHLEGALAFSFEELPGELKKKKLPQSYLDLCK